MAGLLLLFVEQVANTKMGTKYPFMMQQPMIQPPSANGVDVLRRVSDRRIAYKKYGDVLPYPVRHIRIYRNTQLPHVDG